MTGAWGVEDARKPVADVRGMIYRRRDYFADDRRGVLGRQPSPSPIRTIRERLRLSRSNALQALSYDAVVFVQTAALPLS